MAFPVGGRTVGKLITESIWNSDLVDNLNYLKGLSGAVLIEDDLSLSATKSFDADKIYASRYTVHKAVREIVFNWEVDNINDYQIVPTAGGPILAGDVEVGGHGQLSFGVHEDNQCWAHIVGLGEQYNAKDTTFKAANNPYISALFSLDQDDAVLYAFIGFCQTPGNAVPAAQNFAGLFYSGSTWYAINSDGSGQDQTALSVAADERHVVEVQIFAGVGVEVYIDGVLVHTGSSNIPTGDLEWQILFYSAGGGGAGLDRVMTIGKTVLQEDLA